MTKISPRAKLRVDGTWASVTNEQRRRQFGISFIDSLVIHRGLRMLPAIRKCRPGPLVAPVGILHKLHQKVGRMLTQIPKHVQQERLRPKVGSSRVLPTPSLR